ncbi:sigma-70 family RNA polymerase sigma factor [Kribbella turkmenica]|uniref:Sigma-70 family RNA polymerase sigma factor n=2 Tax=Kribbella turkmenica TaxID=2530375 RepID=A0A4R4WEN9_9ACTN|nr:sigma-70 family RNA polymerase sigma factor [Kribbella turkmenica]
MLASLAYRLLGSWHDAEDVLQETYVRWSGVDRAKVLDPRRYLTRVVTRLAIDVLRTRQARRESYLGEWLPEPAPSDPFASVDTSDLSIAVLHLMERLTPPQRAVYVLRTAFLLPYDEIADIIGRSPEDCRQLHKRASTALDRGGPRFEPSPDEQQRLLLDFVAAARDGDLARLESMLKESVTEWSDGAGKRRIARKPVVGRAQVAAFFSRIYDGKDLTVVPLDLVTGPALDVQVPEFRHVLHLEFDGDRIAAIRIQANPDKLAGLS